MTRFDFSSLRVRLILLILLSVLPALGLALYSGLDQRRHARFEALDNALKMAQELSSIQERLIENARQVLFTLSLMPQVRQSDSAACTRIFANLLKQSDAYNGLIAVEPNGKVFASALPMTQPTNLAFRPWFQRVLQARGLVISEYQIGSINKKPQLALAYPVLDDSDQLTAVLSLGIDLEWSKQLMAETKLPAGTLLNILDQKGTILFRYPEPEKYIGKLMPEAFVVKTTLAKGKGVVDAPALDGVPCLFAFTSLKYNFGAIYVNIGIPQKAAFAEADRNMVVNFTWLGLATMLALAAAWFGGNVFILRQVNALRDTAQRLPGGDLSARTGSLSGSGELSQLAGVVDQMAESLGQRDTQLRQAEAKYRVLVEHIPAIIYIAAPDKSGSTLYVSPQIETMLGFSQAEWITDAELWAKQLHPDDRERVLAEYAQASVAGQPFCSEYRLIARDGGTLWFRDDSRVVLDEAEKPLFMQGIMFDLTARKRMEEELRSHRDHLQDLVAESTKGLLKNNQELEREITERKLTEEALRLSEEKYRELVESVNSAIVRVDSQGRITFFNQFAQRIFGFSEEEVLGRPYVGTLAPRTNSEGRDIEQLLNGITTPPELFATNEDENICKDGRPVWIAWTNRAIYDEEGRVTGILGVGMDITEKKRVEQERDRLFNLSLDMFCIVGFDGYFKQLNPACEKTLGWTKKELMAKPYIEFVHPDDRKPTINFTKELSTGRAVLTFDNRYLCKDGSYKWISWNSFPLIEEKLIFAVARDITERKQLEEKLLTSERLATLGLFSGGISHELRNPLSTIDSSVYYLKTKLKDSGEKVKEHLDRIKTSVDSSLSIIESLRTLTRVSDVRLQKIDFASIAFDAISGSNVPKTVKVIRNAPEQEVLVDGDAEQLKIAFKNIIINALQAMDHKGTLEVTVRTDNGEAEASFADTGPGIAPENLDKIFQHFFSTKAKGLGFGLSIAKMIIEKHQGAIEARSELGRGATVLIRLPLPGET
jgi:PAS domain S-box-containing protein